MRWSYIAPRLGLLVILWAFFFFAFDPILKWGLVKGIEKGAKAKADLYMDRLPAQWAATHSHIRYVPVLSEPAADDAWSGRTGFVHQAVLADFPDLSGHQVYACGAPAMIEAAKRDFMARGLPEEEYFADAFSFASN